MLTHKRFFLHIILKYFVCTALLSLNLTASQNGVGLALNF